MDYQTEAQKIYDKMTPAREKWERMGTTPTGAMGATVTEIANHLQICDEVSQEYGFTIHPDKVKFGATREQVQAIAESKAKRYRRRAGVRALERKYGHEAAKCIVKKHSGRTIR